MSDADRLIPVDLVTGRLLTNCLLQIRSQFHSWPQPTHSSEAFPAREIPVFWHFAANRLLNRWCFRASTRFYTIYGVFTEHHSVLTISFFRAPTDCTIFVLRCRGFWSICSIDLCRLTRRHANHHHLEPQGPGTELWSKHYNDHVGPTGEHPDHLQRGLQPRWGVHLQGHQSCWLRHLFS